MRSSREPPATQLSLAPLIDVAFLVLIFFMALPLRRLDHRLEAHLPKDEGPAPFPVPPEPRPKVRIRVLDRPAGVPRYRIGQNTFRTAVEMEPLLRRLGPANEYELFGEAPCPWQDLVAVVDLLTALDYTQVRFRGTRPPPVALRRTSPLPRPAPR